MSIGLLQLFKLLLARLVSALDIHNLSFHSYLRRPPDPLFYIQSSLLPFQNIFYQLIVPALLLSVMPGDDQQQHAPPSLPHQTVDPNQHHHQQQQPRKKRAKIVSACGECRRKKTKCNGEQPCRSCEKSGVACIYPSATQHQDDKRSHFNKAALESIEERLKTIENMLRMILQSSQNSPPDLDPAMVDHFLNNTTGTGGGSTPVVASATITQQPSASSSNSSNSLTSSPPNSLQQPSSSYAHPPSIQQQRISNRLPSIHDLSAFPPGYHPHEQHPEMEPAFPSNSTAHYHSASSTAPQSPDAEQEYGAFQPVKKRKR